MARLFDDAQSEYLEVESLPVAAYPFVLACWFRTDTNTIYEAAMSIGGASVNAYHNLLVAGAAAGDTVWAHSYVGGSGSAIAETSTGFSVDTWHHGCALFVGNADRRVLLDNGGRDTEEVASKVFGAKDRMRIGRYASSTEAYPFSGRIAEAAVWDLSAWPGATASDKADEFERVAVPALAARYSPLFFPLGLASYWPLGGLFTSETDGGTARDIGGGYDLTAYSDTTGPGIANHPGGLIYPAAAIAVPAVAAGGGADINGTTPPNIAFATLQGEVNPAVDINGTTPPNIALAAQQGTVVVTSEVNGTTPPNIAFATHQAEVLLGTYVNGTTPPNIALAAQPATIVAASLISGTTPPNIALTGQQATIEVTSEVGGTTPPNIALAAQQATIVVTSEINGTTSPNIALAAQPAAIGAASVIDGTTPPNIAFATLTATVSTYREVASIFRSGSIRSQIIRPINAINCMRANIEFTTHKASIAT